MSTELDKLADAAGVSLPDILIATIKEAAELRASAVHDGVPTEGPGELHDQLLVHRRALDRLEDHVAKLSRLKARADRAVREKQDVLEDAEAHADQLREEFSTAKERNAHLAVQTMDQRIALRKVTRQRDEIVEALEYCRTLYRGLDGSRRDLDARIRLITLQTSLEK